MAWCHTEGGFPVSLNEGFLLATAGCSTPSALVFYVHVPPVSPAAIFVEALRASLIQWNYPKGWSVRNCPRAEGRFASLSCNKKGYYGKIGNAPGLLVFRTEIFTG